MPDTTVMKDSQVGDAWIAEACRQNPVQQVLNADGTPTGNWLTGPVRLNFCDSLFELKPQMKNDPNSALKASLMCMFTPYTNMQPFYDEYYRVAQTEFAEYWNPAMQQYVGIDNPITDQGFKAHKYMGFTPGLMCTTMSSFYLPPVVDIRGNPIIDQKKVYPGVWAIVAFNTYASGKKFPKKGPRFGLQTVMIIGDDKSLMGGGADPRTQFKAVTVTAPVAIAPGGFGKPNQPPGVPPAGQAYYPPTGLPAAPHMPMLPRPPGAPPAPPVGAPDDEDISQFT